MLWSESTVATRAHRADAHGVLQNGSRLARGRKRINRELHRATTYVYPPTGRRPRKAFARYTLGESFMVRMGGHGKTMAEV